MSIPSRVTSPNVSFSYCILVRFKLYFKFQMTFERARACGRSNDWRNVEIVRALLRCMSVCSERLKLSYFNWKTLVVINRREIKQLLTLTGRPLTTLSLVGSVRRLLLLFVSEIDWKRLGRRFRCFYHSESYWKWKESTSGDFHLSVEALFIDIFLLPLNRWSGTNRAAEKPTADLYESMKSSDCLVSTLSACAHE